MAHMYPYTMDIILVPNLATIVVFKHFPSTRHTLSCSQFNSIVNSAPYLFTIIHVIIHVSSLIKYLYVKE